MYVATGNNYDVPESVASCVQAVLDENPAAPDADAVRACVAGHENFFDAVVALDMNTGARKWATPVMPFDAYTIACELDIFPEQNCPTPSGPDHDFGQAPMLYRPANCEAYDELLGVGQKSGVFWALDPDSGEVVWDTRVGPGGHLGGAMWGSATDGERVYVTESNSRGEPWLVAGNGAAAGTTINHGYWSALDACTGDILWQTPEPSGAMVMAPMTLANGVLYAASLARSPNADTMFALDPSSGEIVWSFASGGSTLSGAAIVDGHVYWGSGYTGGFLDVGVGNGQVYAFELPAAP